ncbi:MAG TPA: argininosuccinate lyase [Vicinamibacterales bacterium]|nr:argininosuccinate lyase [Vicinamibacterales bacterium]
MWHGRFSAPPNELLFDFGKSLPVDRRLLDDDVTGSVAWAGALERAGVLSAADARAIVQGLEGVRAAVAADPSIVDGAPDEDVHSLVERLLIERIGEAGRRLHTGRSRNEQVSLDTRLYVRRRLPLLQQRLVDLVAAFVEQATRSGQAVMPSYTHLRRAQPVLVAHVWLAHAAALRRDVGRLDNARDEADAMPLGSGAIAGTAYAVDTAWLATRLGFSRTVPNSIDTSGDRDFVAVFLFACTLAMTHLSRLAEDIILFTSEEFGYFELADEAATGSSLMPQKKNPDPMELVRGKAGTAIGQLVGWLAAMKGTPLGYNKDYQEDKATLFAAEDTLAQCAAASATLVRAMTPRPDRMREAASGLLLATEVADYLVGRGVAFRTAHEITGRIVQDLVADDRDFAALDLAGWQQYDARFDEDIFARVTPEAAVAARLTPQSTNPSAVEAALDETRAWLRSRTAG